MASATESFFDPFTRNFPTMLCPLCESPGPKGGACARCFAPADVIDSILKRDKPPKFVGVLGPSGVGKTVYLGMLLDLLSREACGVHGIAKGAFSLALHRNVILSLENQRFPEKTPSEPDRWQWAHAEITSTKKRGLAFDIVTPDVAGEAVAAELAQPQSNRVVRALIDKCAALVVLIDIQQVVSSGQSQELFAMQLVSYLTTLRPAKKKRKVDVPVAFVFTKTDLCDEPIDDADGFAQSNAPGLVRLASASLESYKFFASGVAGATAHLVAPDGGETLVPLRVEPRGIVEPIAWLLNQFR